MREIALLMESMLQSVVSKKSYETPDGIVVKPSDDGSGKPPLTIKKSKGKPYIPNSLPKADKLKDIIHAEQE